MRKPSMSGIVPFLCAIVTMAAAAADTAGTSAMNDRPPNQYRLADVVISVVDQPGNPAFNRREVVIGGDGSCRRTDTHPPAEKACGPVPRETLVGLIDAFYRLRFFDLKDRYWFEEHVSVDDEGVVRYAFRRMLDKPSITLCFAVAEYRKCLTFSAGVPDEVSALAKRILALAD